MTVHEYFRQPQHLRYVVAAPVVAEGADRELTALVTSAHQTLAAAKDAVRWERRKVWHDRGDRVASVDRIVVDLESLQV